MNHPTSVLPSVPPENRYTPFPPAKSDNPDECLNGAFVVRVITRIADRYYVGRSMVDTSTFRTMTAGCCREDFEQELALQLVKNAQLILAAREPAALATTIAARKGANIYRHHLVIAKHEIPWPDSDADFNGLEGELPVQGGSSLGKTDKNFCEPVSGLPSGRPVWKADRLFALWNPKQEHRKNPDQLWRERLLAIENEKRLKKAWASFHLLSETEAQVLLYAYGFRGSDISGQIVKRSASEIGQLLDIPTRKVSRIIQRAERVLQEACGERPLKRLKRLSDGSLERVDAQAMASTDTQSTVSKDATDRDNRVERETHLPSLVDLAPIQAAV